LNRSGQGEAPAPKEAYATIEEHEAGTAPGSGAMVQDLSLERQA
jgi:hypothetical protein